MHENYSDAERRGDAEAIQTDNMTQAVSTAVVEFLRRRRLEKLRSFRGKVEILSNDKLEAVEMDELEGRG